MAVDASGKGICKVYRLEAHTWFSTKANKVLPRYQVTFCPKYKHSSNAEQGQILSEAKKDIGICRVCSEILHKIED